MQQTKPFSFRRIRSFDEVLADTFSFLRAHFRYLGKHLLTIVLPVILLTAVVQGIALSNTTDTGSTLFPLLIRVLEFLPDIFTQIITCIYIVLCSDLRGEVPDSEQVRTGTMREFWRIFGSNILYVLATGIGLFIFLVPGVYIGVALLMLTMVIVEEDRTIFSAFDRCFTLVKGYWWQTFGLAFVLFLILMVMGMVAAAPVAVIMFASDMLTLDPSQYGLYSLISSCIENIADVLVTVVFSTAIALHYYSLVEHKEATGLRERISELDQQQNDEAQEALQP